MAALRNLGKADLLVQAEALQSQNNELNEIIDRVSVLIAELAVALKPNVEGGKFKIGFWNVIKKLPTVIAIIRELIQVIIGAPAKAAK